MNDTLNRFFRTVLQVLAAGGFTAVFEALTDLSDSRFQTLIAAVFMLIVVLAQNWLENSGVIPKFLKPNVVTVTE